MADAVVYMVRTKSKASCQRELDLICERMGAVAVTDPTDAAGRHWVARAVPAPTTQAASAGPVRPDEEPTT